MAWMLQVASLISVLGAAAAGSENASVANQSLAIVTSAPASTPLSSGQSTQDPLAAGVGNTSLAKPPADSAVNLRGSVNGSWLASCDRIPADRVWDVQWSGDRYANTEFARSFNAPFNPSTRRRLIVEHMDYFTLKKRRNGKYKLKHYGFNGVMKSSLPAGEVKANTAVVFIIINGFYGTVIPRRPHRRGDSARYEHLVWSPSRSLVQRALGSSCLA